MPEEIRLHRGGIDPIRTCGGSRGRSPSLHVLCHDVLPKADRGDLRIAAFETGDRDLVGILGRADLLSAIVVHDKRAVVYILAHLDVVALCECDRGRFAAASPSAFTLEIAVSLSIDANASRDCSQMCPSLGFRARTPPPAPAKLWLASSIAW